MKKFAKIISAFILVVLSMIILTACVPSSAEKAIKKMKEEGYSAMSYSVTMIEGATEGFTATDADNIFDVEIITAVWFESVEDAKAFEEAFNESDNELVKRKGKCVYYGTADAIEDFED